MRTTVDLPPPRELQHRLRAAGVRFEREADETTTGPASFIVVERERATRVPSLGSHHS